MKKYNFTVNSTFKNSKIYKVAVKILEKLSKKGYTAYFAGGVVRDLVLNKKCKDIDIATNAKPDDIIKLFRKCILVGKQFGVIRVIYYGIEYEIATFRKDTNYIDGRHPEKVEWTDAEEDAKRRDFTINALFFDGINENIIDFVNGMKDIKNKIIRAVGNAEERFEEDKLRILRGIRFSIRLGFKIEKNTLLAIKKYSNKITEVSFERIRDEFKLILTSQNPDKAILLMSKTGILKEILPEIEKLKGVKQTKKFHPEGDVFKHTVLMLKNMKNPTWQLAFAVLLHDVGKPDTMTVSDRIRFNGHDTLGKKISQEICDRFKLSKKDKDNIVDLVNQHMKFINVQKMRVSTLKKFLKAENFNEHLELHKLDCISSHGKIDNYIFCKKKKKEYKKDIEREKLKIIRGKDLIILGLKPGPLFTKILNEIEEMYLEKQLQTKEEAIEHIKNKYC